MTLSSSAVVKQLPVSLVRNRAHEFFREASVLFERDRPSVVFDFSQVRELDSRGIEVLLQCMEEAMKRNGDLKFAALSPQVFLFLEFTRVNRLFEIFENVSDAVESYRRFPVKVSPEIYAPGGPASLGHPVDARERLG